MTITYEDIIRCAIDTEQVTPSIGRMTLMVWHDQGHFDEWANLVEISEDVRVLDFPLDLVSSTLLDGFDYAKMAVVGIAFAMQTDCSDIDLMCYAVVGAVNRQL